MFAATHPSCCIRIQLVLLDLNYQFCKSKSKSKFAGYHFHRSCPLSDVFVELKKTHLSPVIVRHD